MEERSSDPTENGNVCSSTPTWNVEPEVQYRSTINRLTLASFQDILWNVCENYQNILSQLQTAKSTGTGNVAMTGAMQVVSLGRKWITTGSTDLEAPSELLEENQHEDFMGVIAAVKDAFEKHDNAAKELKIDDSSDSWQKNYFELYDLFITTTELNGQLHRGLASQRSAISALRMEANQKIEIQQRTALELQPIKEMASLTETNAKLLHELSAAVEAKLTAERERDLVFSKLESILQHNQESEEVQLRLQEENINLKQQLDMEKAKTNVKTTEMESVKVELSKLADANAAFETGKRKSVSSAQQELQQRKDMTKELNAKNAEISALKSDIEANTAENAKWSERCEAFKQKLDDMNRKASNREKEIAELRKRLRRNQQGPVGENFSSMPPPHHRQHGFAHGPPWSYPPEPPLSPLLIPSGQFSPDAGRGGRSTDREYGRPIPSTHGHGSHWQ